MDRLLFIVAQDRPDLYKYLTWHFSSEKDVQVIFNQRGKERRQGVERQHPERRRADRRRQAAVNRDPFSLNHVITRRIEEEIEPAVDRRQVGGQHTPHGLEKMS